MAAVMHNRRYFRAGFFDNSPISEVTLDLQIPAYLCSVCQSSFIDSTLAYPHLNPQDVLPSTDLGKLRVKNRASWSNDEMISIVRTLRRQWEIPVAPGSNFGPIRIKVSSRPRVDFDVLPKSTGLFGRRPAIESLIKGGWSIQYIECPSWGKYAREADFVQLVVPVAGHFILPEHLTLCRECLRCCRTRPVAESGLGEAFLEEHPALDSLPFFRTVEYGALIFSAAFVAATIEMGVTGLVDGDTIKPIHTMTKANTVTTR